MLHGKTIIITGVSSGIGKRTAELAISMGAEVIGVDLHKPEMPLGTFIEVDLSDKASIDALLKRLPAKIDALCNVAGLAGTLGAPKTMAVNFFGLRYLTRGVAPHIREGGSVVNVASIAGYGWRANLERTKAVVAEIGFPSDMEALCKKHGISELSYVNSKEALLLWTMQAAHEPLFKSRGIRVNAVSPGPVETPILPQFRIIIGDERVDSDISRVGKAGTVSEIAPVILFLCQDASRWINGANIPVDGGLEASVNAEVIGF
jgi:NAD(P)-dependent dehydrogenase (short-subunit alcohol dehydrogenase family)